MFTQEEYDALKAKFAPVIEFRELPARVVPKESGGRSRPQESPKKRYSRSEILRAGPQGQTVSGAYDMTPFVQEPRKNDRGEYIGVRRERQTDLKNRRYSILSRS